MQKAGYIRVSTTEQAENSQALEQQKARIEPFVDIFYCEIESGTKDNRTEFQRLIQDCEKGKISEIYITRLDRLSRRSLTLIKTIEDLEKLNIKVVALDDHIDTQSAIGKFSLNMTGALAQMESDRLSERIKHGWEYTRKLAKAVNPPFGYTVKNDKYYFDIEPVLCTLIDKKTYSRYQLARKTIDIFLEEKSLRKTIRVLNELTGYQRLSKDKYIIGKTSSHKLSWSSTGLKKYLVNPVLRGHTYYPIADKLILNTHTDRLLSEDEFNYINWIIDDNRKRKGFGASQPKYTLSGLVYCANCNGAMGVKRGGGKNSETIYYQCRNWGTRTCDNKQCIKEDYIYNYLVRFLVSESKRIAEYHLENKEINHKEIELKKNIKQLEKMGDNPAINEAKQKLLQELKAIRIQDSSHQLERKQLLETMNIIEDKSFWDNLPVDDKRVVFSRLIDKVFVYKRKIIKIVLNDLIN